MRESWDPFDESISDVIYRILTSPSLKFVIHMYIMTFCGFKMSLNPSLLPVILR
jgi:hypothetical protein